LKKIINVINKPTPLLVDGYSFRNLATSQSKSTLAAAHKAMAAVTLVGVGSPIKCKTKTTFRERRHHWTPISQVLEDPHEPDFVDYLAAASEIGFHNLVNSYY